MFVEVSFLKRYLPWTTLFIVILLAIELPILSTLSVWASPLGGLTLFYLLLLQLGPLTVFYIAVMWAYSRSLRWLGIETKGRKLSTINIIYGLFISIITFVSFVLMMNNALALDIDHTWVLAKSGLDYLTGIYLRGSVIWFTLLIALLFAISDFRISYGVGTDGKRYLYTHSKILGLLRLLWKRRKGLGSSADHPVIGGEQSSISGAHFNDRVRLIPDGALWMFLKFVAGLFYAEPIARAIAPEPITRALASRYLLIQGYMDQAGASWPGLLARYLQIFTFRLGPSVYIPPTFPVDEVFTFEFFQLMYGFAYWFILIWVVRVAIAFGANMLVYWGFGGKRPLVEGFVNITAAVALASLIYVLGIPAWAFDQATPFYAWSLFLGFSALGLIALSVRVVGKIRLITAMTLLLLTASLVLAPIAASKLTVEPFMEGRYREYIWEPKTLPAIYYARWALALHDVERTDISTISTNSTNYLKQIRLLSETAAYLNMKPLVGVNWMSIDGADTDLILINERQYWASVLTLVSPTDIAAIDPDAWRATHLILTHGERVLVMDAATAQVVDAQELFNLSNTPRIYYGEGGLWGSEAYLHIGKFKEQHLPDYVGPETYDHAADYVYRGFWRFWRFVWQLKWDFALGNYGDIEALASRDLTSRVSRLIISSLSIDWDGYPVTDGNGNLYMLYWSYTRWPSPHNMIETPHFGAGVVERKFALILVNMENGEIDGYLVNAGGDYVLNYFNSFYEKWNKPLPEWLVSQIRYSDYLLSIKASFYNSAFQDDFVKWQANQFFEFPYLEETPKGKMELREPFYLPMTLPDLIWLRWTTNQLVEWFQSPSRNLAGIYVAYGGEDVGHVHFVDFENTTTAGPWAAYSAVVNNPDPQLQLLLKGQASPPRDPLLVRGEILIYAYNNKLFYVIPFYSQQPNLLLPALVAVVDSTDLRVGYYIIQNPKDPVEVENSPIYAFEMLEKG